MPPATPPLRGAARFIRGRIDQIPRDDDAFAGFLGDVLDVLAEDAPPPGDCSCCEYHRKLQRLKTSS